MEDSRLQIADSRVPVADATTTEGYLTKQEVARRLKKTVRTIENWQARGIIPFIKAGRSVLFNWPDVQAHLQRNFRVCRLEEAASPMANVSSPKSKVGCEA